MSEETTGAPRPVLVATLVAVQREGRLTPTRLAEAASLAGVSTRTIKRWVAAGEPATYDRSRYVAVDRDLDAFFEANGRYGRAWAKRTAEDGAVPSLSTWSRAVKRGTTLGDRAYAKGGQRAVRDVSVYLPVEAVTRNAVWEADHKMLDVYVLPMRGAKPRRPWMTTFLDAFSRAVMGYAISVTPSAASIVAGLHAAVEHDPTRGPFRGAPERIHFDNGRDWLSDDVTQVMIGLGATPIAVSPYMPHHKGKVERFQGTLVENFLSQHPFFTGGPKTTSGMSSWPSTSPPLITQFVEELDAYVNRYNLKREHRKLGGQTPLTVWNSTATPLREISPAVLHLILPRQRRKVNKDGIHFEGQTYLAPELHALGGEEVDVAYRPHDHRKIHVYFEDRWVCAAQPAQRLTPDERAVFLQARKSNRAAASNRRRKATARTGMRLAPLTGPGQPATDTRVATARNHRRDSEEAQAPLAAAARRLLGLD